MNNGISNQASLRRLMRDLKEITNEPIQGVSAAPVNDNLFVWHGNLDASLIEVGSDAAFHYVMTFSEDYPKDPPVIELSTYLPHLNVFSGGSYICLDMLEEGEWAYESEKARPYTGWSSCYTVRSLLMQLQSFLMDESRIYVNEVPDALEDAKSFSCLGCEHKPNNIWPPIPTIADIQAATTKVVVQMPTLVTMLPSVAVSLETWEEESRKTVKAVKSVIPQADGWNLVMRKSTSDNARSTGTSDNLAAVNQFNLLPSAEEQKALEEQEITLAVSEEPKSAGQIQGSERKDTKTARKNKARAQKRALLRAQNQPPADAIPIEVLPAACSSSASNLDDIIITTGKPQGSLGDLPYEVLISVISRLPTLKDILSLASTCRFLHNVVEDGWMWREVFCRQYPKSNLTAASMRDWKYAYAMEHNNIISETVCFHTKMNVNEEILGIPITYTTDWRKKVNYIYSTMDFIGVKAYKDDEVRKTVWKEKFTSFLPLYFTQDHFMRAVNEFENSIVQLSTHLKTPRFYPKMVLEVLPKLMNSYVVQLSKGDTYASERAVHGYFLIYRLLMATLDYYPQLKPEIHKRVKNYILDEEARNKTNYPSLGDFIPLVTISSYSWDSVAPAVLSEIFDRNVQWICKAHPELANVDWQQASTEDSRRNRKSFEASIVSYRLLMFHVYFMRTFRRKPLTAMAAELDRFYGQPTAAVTRSFQAQIKRILVVKTWPEFYAFIQRPCPNPLQLTQMLEQSVSNSLRRRYHNRNTIKPGYNRDQERSKPVKKDSNVALGVGHVMQGLIQVFGITESFGI